VSLDLAVTGVSALLSLIVIYPLYHLLRLRFIHSFREWGPEHHKEKGAIPTAGGLLFVIVPLAVVPFSIYVLGDALDLRSSDLTLSLLLLLVCTAFAVLGFIDDFIKAATQSSRGLLARYKLVLQVVVALTAVHFAAQFGTLAFLPWSAEPATLPSWLYYSLGTFLLVGMVNAMNFTDGLDGLAPGMALLSLAAFVFILNTELISGLLAGRQNVLSYISLVVAGAVLAFLVVNFRPALIYLGDTGSYFLGAFIGYVAILSGLLIYLIPLALIYGLELISVIVQVAYFRTTGGKRLLKMSPLHHHFELSGLSEIATVLLFWMVHALVCAGSVALFYRFTL
jgi:phospho-N-acetylmuramoyl-pentapeptide-transferase